MDDQTIFIIVGLTLVAMALIVSFLGLRSDDFPPSRGVLLGGIAVFAVVVAGALTFAWKSATDEQTTRDEEIASGERPSPGETQEEMVQEFQASTAESSGDAAEGEPGGAPETEGGPTTASVDGAALFDSQGCSGCHALQAAGASGDVGPDLDAELKGESVAFIEESIVSPDSEVEEGFSAGIMPDDFEQQMSPEELDALVQFIADSVGAKQ